MKANVITIGLWEISDGERRWRLDRKGPGRVVIVNEHGRHIDPRGRLGKKIIDACLNPHRK